MVNKLDKGLRYKLSESHLERSLKVIPLGSQTFSKSITQYPFGISPLYIRRAKGSKVWDLDGNKYIDFVNSLASITIGYGDKDINRSVKKQLNKGVSFSLPGTLEAEVAELITELVPSAEMMRFGKNGTDATSAAVRLSRAYTNRDHVLVCGYHGWQDWYIGSTSRNKGVPKIVQQLTHAFEYNNIQSLRKLFDLFPNQIACVVMEPMNSKWPEPGFLESVRDLCTINNAVLVFDETITGFRYARGGAQELFKIKPDLTAFGKGIANGFPLSVIAGKREIMKEMEQIFFSGTFGGELLSLAAAKSVLLRHMNSSLTNRLSFIGSRIVEELQHVISETNMTEFFSVSGHPSWSFLNWHENETTEVSIMKTYFMQEMFEQGILILNTHNVSTSMTSSDIDSLILAYQETFFKMSEGIQKNKLHKMLKVDPLVPLFKVR